MKKLILIFALSIVLMSGLVYGIPPAPVTLSQILILLGYTPEDVANKSTSGSLGSSDTLYPSQKAVKTYADTKIGDPGTVVSGYIASYQGTTGLVLSTGVDNTTFIMTTTPEVVVTKNASYTLGTDAAKENYGGMVFLTAAATLTLPAAVVGMNGCVMATGTFAISVDANGADHFVLNGTALTAGNKVTSTGVAGDTLCWTCGAANTWYTLPGSNVNWIDGG